MNGMASRLARFSMALLGLVIVGWVLTGQAAKPVRQGIPLPTDWSHRHLIFSQPATVEQARRIGNEPRYWQQVERLRQRVLVHDEQAGADLGRLLGMASHGGRARTMHRDWSVDLGTSGKVGAGNYPAKFSFNSTTANCTTDYVVFSTGLAGGLTQASIVAFNNLYSGCGGTVPSVLWAYNTNQVLGGPVPGIIQTSPVLSKDGTQIAFAQTDGVGAAVLVLLKWAPSVIESVSLPGIPLQVPPAAYHLCVAPCMTVFPLRDHSVVPVATDDTMSSVFMDYAGDTAWVGDSRGLLHKFNPVFNGTPAEIRNATWPQPVSSGLGIGSPVHDHISGNVYVGGAGSTGFPGDGILYRVNSTNGVVTASGTLDFGVGIVAGPIVDSSNGTVYVSASSDGSLGCLDATLSAVDCAAVYQLPVNFASGDPGTEVVTGVSTDPSVGPPNPMYDGFFDSTYLNSLNGTGNFYVCGNTGANPILFQVPITAGAFGTPVAVSTLTTAASTAPCSPVTDVSNPNTSGGASERVFASVQDNGRPTKCAGAGCVINFVDTPWLPSTAYTVGQEVLVFTTFNPNVLFINVVTTAGTSAIAPPAHWPTTAGAVTNNGTVQWLNQGPITAVPLTNWSATHAFGLHGRIIDSNGNVEVVTVAGTSGAAPPVWATTAGATTNDGLGTLKWINAGALPTAALAAAGGTSGIIIDNTVGAGTLAGASQVYFSTLTDQATCTGGVGGCAVQASQPALQ